MFIIKFNNMVKNKWIWAAFAIIVAVAFGASDMLSANARGDRDAEHLPHGTADAGAHRIRHSTADADPHVSARRGPAARRDDAAGLFAAHHQEPGG